MTTTPTDAALAAAFREHDLGDIVCLRLIHNRARELDAAKGGEGGNFGHGHVWPRPDGVKARCGGPGVCAACSVDAARYRPTPPTQPGDAVERDTGPYSKAVQAALDKYHQPHLPTGYAWPAPLRHDMAHALRAAIAAMPASGEAVAVRTNEDGSLDEIVGYGSFHLEQMDGNQWWMALGPHMVNLTAKGKIVAHFGENEASTFDAARGEGK